MSCRRSWRCDFRMTFCLLFIDRCTVVGFSQLIKGKLILLYFSDIWLFDFNYHIYTTGISQNWYFCTFPTYDSFTSTTTDTPQLIIYYKIITKQGTSQFIYLFSSFLYHNSSILKYISYIAIHLVVILMPV
jgi:hypothetical protein